MIEDNKYKIINLLFSLDDVNFSLGYELSKNMSIISAFDIESYFSNELNKKNYHKIFEINDYLNKKMSNCEEKYNNIWSGKESFNYYYTLLNDNFKYTLTNVHYDWGDFKINFKINEDNSMVIVHDYLHNHSYNRLSATELKNLNLKDFLPKFKEYKLNLTKSFKDHSEIIKYTNEVNDFILMIKEIDFVKQYYLNNKEKINRNIIYLQFLKNLIKEFRSFDTKNWPYDDIIKKRYFKDKLQMNSFPLKFENSNAPRDSKFQVNILSVDKKCKTCNVVIHKWKGGWYSGYLNKRNYKKRNIDILFKQIKHLIKY